MSYGNNRNLFLCFLLFKSYFCPNKSNINNIQPLFQQLQRFINEYTSSLLLKSIRLFELKAGYWDDKTMYDHIHDEIDKTSCDLVELHKKFPLLHVVTNYHDLKNILRDSTFIESISPDERKKYRNYDNIYISTIMN